jgi:hypothetical protein
VRASINRGSIRGTVSDPSGAVMPNVNVTITNTDTGVKTTGHSNAAGFYLFPELVPGNYDVHFETQGFAPADVTSTVVKPNEVSTVDLQLKVGAQAQHVEVTGTNPLVETSATNVGTAVAQRIVGDLPILGRDTQALVNLVPGVTSSIGPPGTLVGFNGGEFGGFPDATHIMGSFVSANGAQPGGSEWYLDGNLNSMEGQDNMAVDPPPDALAEFQSINTSFAAEYGRKEGAIFSEVIKSGTNRFHGDIYEYNRNSYFSARNPMAAPLPDGTAAPPNYVNWNQFGGTIGGPVHIPHIYNGTNKTFFFFAWDVSLLHESGPWLGSVPTVKEHAGDFSDFPSVRQYGIYDPLTTTYNAEEGVYTRKPFLNANGTLATSLPANRIDPTAQWIMNQFPAPNFVDPRQQNAAAGGCLNTCNNYQSTYGNSQTGHSIVAKVDHEISQKDKLFVDYLWNPGAYRFLRYAWESATAPLAGFNGTYPYNVHNQLATLGETHAFSPTLVNEFRFTWARQFEQALPEDPVMTHEADMLEHIQGLNIPVFPPYQPVPSWYIGNGVAGQPTGAYFGSPVNNMIISGNNFTVLDNITKIHAKHTIKAGFTYRSDITGSEFPTESNMNFSHALTQNPVTGQGGQPYAQFMLGTVDQSTNLRYVMSTIGSDHYIGAYVQDDYRVTSKLTLNFGLRWDVFTWFNDRHDNYGMIDLNRPDPIDPIRMGAIVYPTNSEHPNRRPFPANKNDFGPRLNFSYTPSSNGKTVIRGGWDMIYVNDISYDLGPAVGANEAVGYTPSPSYVFNDITGQQLYNTQQVPAYILSQGAPNLNLPTSNPRITKEQWNGPGVAGYGGGFFSFLPYSHDPYTMIYNLQVQREITPNLMISVGYVGAQGRHITNQGGQIASDRMSTAQRIQYKSTANHLVPTPADLVAVGWPAMEPLSNTLHNWQQWEPFSVLSWPINNTDYNSLQVRVEKRFSHGFNVLAAYTVQKTIADAYVGAFCSNNWVGVSGWANGRGRMTELTFSGPRILTMPKAIARSPMTTLHRS